MIRPIFLSNLNKKVSVDQFEDLQQFVTYPNPANNLLFVDSKEDEFKITDLQGRQVVMFIKNPNGLDVSFINPGVYFVTALKSGVSQKIIIE